MTVTVLCGDAIARLRELPADSVHCVVTSPPYWGLRDYGTGTWEGGDPACGHVNGQLVSNKSTLRNDGREHKGPYDGEKAVSTGMPYLDLCAKCGARRIDQQIGLEPMPEAWAARLVEVFREVRRVLRPDGCCFVNIGDSYDAGTRASRDYSKTTKHGYWNNPSISNRSSAGLKPKDLIGQPWLLAFALRADGWWLRSEIIWAKPNPMPESVSDRPTKAHEQVFLLTKSARYFWDAEAVKERAEHGENRATYAGGTARLLNGNVASGGFQPADRGLTRPETTSRNLRSVWSIATEPFPEAHFATFPTELARRCILAGTSAKGCCPACGAPWARVVEREVSVPQRDRYAGSDQGKDGRRYMRNGGFYPSSETAGWRPSCACDAGEPVPCTVLDPFAGSGTAGLVASRLGRRAILIDLASEYCAMAERRLRRAGVPCVRHLGEEPAPPSGTLWNLLLAKGHGHAPP